MVLLFCENFNLWPSLVPRNQPQTLTCCSTIRDCWNWKKFGAIQWQEWGFQTNAKASLWVQCLLTKWALILLGHIAGLPKISDFCVFSWFTYSTQRDFKFAAFLGYRIGYKCAKFRGRWRCYFWSRVIACQTRGSSHETPCTYWKYKQRFPVASNIGCLQQWLSELTEMRTFQNSTRPHRNWLPMLCCSIASEQLARCPRVKAGTAHG